MAYEVLPVVKKTPVLAGVNGTDPFIIPGLFLEELRALGFAGIQNSRPSASSTATCGRPSKRPA